MNLSNPVDREAFATQIKNDINDYCANKESQRHSNRLPASMLGESCSRKLFYIFRWVKLEQFDGRMKRLFQVGHDAEPRFAEYLNNVGFEIWEKNPETNKQFEINGCDGHYGGYVDGIAIYSPTKSAKYLNNVGFEIFDLDPNEKFLCEFKTNGTGSGFTDVETKGLAKAKPKHWAQINQYAYKLGIKYGLYLIENKNDSDITVQIVELDHQFGMQLEKKAQDIIEAKSPPPRISDQPSYYECKFCSFVDICHHGECVEENCRSCKNSQAVENAEWRCNKWNTVIPKDQIGLKHECHESINE